MKKDRFPWEDRGRLGFLQALTSSLHDLILSPVQSFGRITPDGPFMPPLLFGVLCLTVGSMASQIWGFAFRSVFGPVIETWLQSLYARFPALSGTSFAPPGQFQLLFRLALGLLLAPVGAVISLFVSSALYHISLIVIRAPRKTFETTFTAVCYGSGAAGILLLVPLLGWLAAWIL